MVQIKSNLQKENLRQAVHLLIGIAAVFVVQFIGFNSALLLMAAVFLGGLFIANFKLLGGKVKLVDQFLQLVDREVAIPGQGAMYYAAGILLLLTFARPLDFALAVVVLHAAGDAVATLVGIRFKSPLPWNKNKSWHGFVAFIIAGVFTAQFFIPFHQAIVYSFILAVVESLAIAFDDNLSVPVAALLFKGVGI